MYEIQLTYIINNNTFTWSDELGTHYMKCNIVLFPVLSHLHFTVCS